jgi:hypothetical protein
LGSAEKIGEKFQRPERFSMLERKLTALFRKLCCAGRKVSEQYELKKDNPTLKKIIFFVKMKFVSM